MKTLLDIMFIIMIVGFSQQLRSNEDSLYQDSITNILNSDINDSSKIRTLYVASKNLKNSNPQLALSYAYDALELVKNTNDSILKGLVNNRIGLLYLRLGNFDLAEEFILKKPTDTIAAK